MPPVFGPSSLSPRRLKSCAGCIGSTVVPSVIANSDTSGPSRYSSISTCSHSAACAERLVAVRGDHDALAGGQPVVLHDVRRPERVDRLRGLLGRRTHVGPAGRHTRRGHHVLGERLRPLDLRRPPGTGRRRRSRPRAAGRPARPPAAPPVRPRPDRRRTRVASATTASWSEMSTERQTIVCPSYAGRNTAMPGLPGAATTCSTSESWASAQTSACSRPPEPITKTFTGHQPSVPWPGRPWAV